MTTTRSRRSSMTPSIHPLQRRWFLARTHVVFPSSIMLLISFMMLCTLLQDAFSPASVHAQLIVRSASPAKFKMGGSSKLLQQLNLQNVVRAASRAEESDYLQCESPGLNISLVEPVTLMEDGTLRMLCNLSRDQNRFSKYDAAGIYWEFQPDSLIRQLTDRRLSPETDARVQVTQEGFSSTLTLQHVRQEDSGTYQCMHNTAMPDLKLPWVCSRHMAVGGPPAKYVNFTCESLGHANFTCEWERGDDYVAGDSKTTYGFYWSGMMWPVTKCNVWWSGDSRYWGCRDNLNMNNKENHFMRHYPMRFLIEGKNAFGSHNWSFPEDGPGVLPRYYIRPLAPIHAVALPLNTTAMLVSWPFDEYKINPPFLLYQLQMRAEYDITDSNFYPYNNIIDYRDENLPNSLIPAMAFTTNHPDTPTALTLTITKPVRPAYAVEVDDIPSIMAIGADEKWVTVSGDPSVNAMIEPPQEIANTNQKVASNITIAGLLPYTLYQFRLRSHPIVDGYWGAFSPIFSNRTLPAKPQGSVVPIPGAFDVVSSNVTHQNMTVYWTALAPWRRNGPDFHYEVKHMPLRSPAAANAAASGKQQEHHPRGRSSFAQELPSAVRVEQVRGSNFTFAYELGQTYQVIVRPVNRVGESSESTKMLLEKKEGLQVTRIAVVQLPTAPNVYAVTIRWGVAGTAAPFRTNLKPSTSSNAVSTAERTARIKRQILHANGLETVPGDENPASNGHDLYNAINATVYYCLATADPSPTTNDHFCISHLMSKVIPLSLSNQREHKVQTLLQLKTGSNIKYQFAAGVSAVPATGTVMTNSKANNNGALQHVAASPSTILYSGLKWSTCLIVGDRQIPEFDFVDHVATENATLQITWRLKCEDRAELLAAFKIYIILCPLDQTIEKPSYCAQVLGTSLSNLPQTEVVAERQPSFNATSARTSASGNSSLAPADVAAVMALGSPAAQHSLLAEPPSPHAASTAITEEESLNHDYVSLNNSFAVLLKITDRTSFAVKGLLPLRKYVVAVSSVSPDGTESEPKLSKLIVETTERLQSKDSTRDDTIMIVGILLGLFFALMIVICACCWKRFRKVYREAKAEFRNIKLPEPALMQMSLLASSTRAAAAAANAAADAGYAAPNSITGGKQNAIANENYYAQIPNNEGGLTGAGYIDAQRLVGSGVIAPVGILTRQLSVVSNGYGPVGVERMYITRFEDPEEEEDEIGEEEEKIFIEGEQKRQSSEDVSEQQQSGEKQKLIQRAMSYAVPAGGAIDADDQATSVTVLLTRSKSSNSGAVDQIKSGAASKRLRVTSERTTYSPLAVNNTKGVDLQLPSRRLGNRLRSFGARAAATFLGGGSSSALSASDNRKASESSAQKSDLVGTSNLAAVSEPKLSETVVKKMKASIAAATASAADINTPGNTERSFVTWAADGVPLLPKTSVAKKSSGPDAAAEAVEMSTRSENSTAVEQESAYTVAPKGYAAETSDPQIPVASDTGKEAENKVIGWLATARGGKTQRRDITGENETGENLDDLHDISDSQSTVRGNAESDAYQDVRQLLRGKSNEDNSAFSGGTNIDECYLATRGLLPPAASEAKKVDKPRKKKKSSKAAKVSSVSATNKSLPEPVSSGNFHLDGGGLSVSPRKVQSASPNLMSVASDDVHNSSGKLFDIVRSSPKQFNALITDSYNASRNNEVSNASLAPQASSVTTPLLQHQNVSMTSVDDDDDDDDDEAASPDAVPAVEDGFSGSSPYVLEPRPVRPLSKSPAKSPARSLMFSSPSTQPNSKKAVAAQSNVMPATEKRQTTPVENSYILRHDSAAAAPPESNTYVVRDDVEGMAATFAVENDRDNFAEAENGYVVERRRGR